MPYLAGVRAFVSSVTGVIILALLAALMVQTVRIEGFKIWPLSITGYKAKLESASAELRTISDKRNEQREETKGNVEKARESDQSAHRIKEQIIAAPDTKNCETPPIILSADL